MTPFEYSKAISVSLFSAGIGALIQHVMPLLKQINILGIFCDVFHHSPPNYYIKIANAWHRTTTTIYLVFILANGAIGARRAKPMPDTCHERIRKYISKGGNTFQKNSALDP
jgi:hypothetical protein